ncbi:MaoC family dehydratase [Natrinema caseinilyticum]|uniref:MaoC family dehydratase n=1 Tax=Natrinema caseinilyticum TaxID=2961570 RepID=UPI0020C348E6|nr:MaoC/PaaZ C-terminal domain-containing protein [Natrinema caseinilyticum]
MDGKYYEDFTVGETYTSSWRYISESDLRQFLALTGLQEPLFESRQFLESETDHETWIVPGYLTLSYSLGLFSRSGWIEGTGLAMLGADSLEFTNPVSVGDEIRTHVEVADTSPTSSDRGGVVVLDWIVLTHDDDVVIEMTSSHFIKKRE